MYLPAIAWKNDAKNQLTPQKWDVGCLTFRLQ